MTKLNITLIFAAGLACLTPTNSWAKDSAPSLGYSESLSDQNYTQGFNFGVGLSVAQPVFSLDYKYRLSNNFGFGGYGYYTSKRGDRHPGVGALGVDMVASVSAGSIDFYVRPGLGVTYFEAYGSKVAFLSPLVAYGATIRVANNLAVGLEHVQLFNWTSNDQAEKTEAVLASLQWRY